MWAEFPRSWSMVPMGFYSMWATYKECRRPVSNYWQIRFAARIWGNKPVNMLDVIFVPARLSNDTKNSIVKQSLLPDFPRLLPNVILPHADNLCRCGMR